MDAHGDRIAIVTGTSRGIGAALAGVLLERGWNVAGIARHSSPLVGSRYQDISLDLSDASALAALETELGDLVSDSRWRRVALVNNAAAGGALAPIETLDPIEHARLAVVNVVAPAWLIGFVMRRTPSEAALRIVNVSSGAAVRAFPGLADYCASKAALRMFGMVAAAELESEARRAAAPRNVAVLSFEPGTVDTKMQETARTRPLSEYPWGGLFRDFFARGALVSPRVPAAEIADFLDADDQPLFSERRLQNR
jgi:benzil reductase ((S)-benzoin forming)